MPVCKHCFEKLLNHYEEVLGDPKAAMERLCLKFDMYWNPDICKMVPKDNTSGPRATIYSRYTNLQKHVGKTYDTTLDEEYAGKLRALSPSADIAASLEEESAPDSDGAPAKDSSPVRDRSVKMSKAELARAAEFWGAGFTKEFYYELNTRYRNWTADIPGELDKAEQALYKQSGASHARRHKKCGMYSSEAGWYRGFFTARPFGDGRFFIL